jgi:serine/threonine-protein phosphatase 2B catalytic subunit
MLIAILNCCTKEELEEEEETPMAITPETEQEELGKSLSLLHRVRLTFQQKTCPESDVQSSKTRSLLSAECLEYLHCWGKLAAFILTRSSWRVREESERVTELKSISGSAALPSGALASGSEGIKEAIQGFDDARKSDIENERLPPDIIDVSLSVG